MAKRNEKKDTTKTVRKRFSNNRTTKTVGKRNKKKGTTKTVGKRKKKNDTRRTNYQRRHKTTITLVPPGYYLSLYNVIVGRSIILNFMDILCLKIISPHVLI